MALKKRTKVRVYFTGKSSTRNMQKLGAAAAVSLILSALLLYQEMNDLALGFLLLGALLATVPLGHRAIRPSDTDLDTWQEDGLNDLLQRALDRCNVVSSELVRPHVTVIGPAIEEVEGSEFRWRKGKDGQIRFNPMKVAIVLFLEYQLAVYQCIFDLISGKQWNEGALIIQYRHVVAIATQAEDIRFSIKDLDPELLRRYPELTKTAVEGKVILKCAECFVLSTADGRFLKVYLQDPLLFKEAKGESPALEKAREAVRSIQARLQEVAAMDRIA